MFLFLLLFICPWIVTTTVVLVFFIIYIKLVYLAYLKNIFSVEVIQCRYSTNKQAIDTRHTNNQLEINLPLLITFRPIDVDTDTAMMTPMIQIMQMMMTMQQPRRPPPLLLCFSASLLLEVGFCVYRDHSFRKKNISIPGYQYHNPSKVSKNVSTFWETRKW